MAGVVESQHGDTTQTHELTDMNTAAPAETEPSATTSEQPVQTTLPAVEHHVPIQSTLSPPVIAKPQPATLRTDSEAIGPSTDLPTPLVHQTLDTGAEGLSVKFILLLASSTGTRHAYQINERYLTNRDVTAKDSEGVFDPTVLSVYTLKELILRDWRDDWEAKPLSPSSIRLISFGQLLGDNATLKECKIYADGDPRVLHLTVKPPDMVDREGAEGPVLSSAKHPNHAQGRACCCIVM